VHPILLLVALVAVLFLFSWYKRVPKAKQRRFRNRALLIGGGILLFFALITGRLHPLFAGLAALVPRRTARTACTRLSVPFGGSPDA